MTVSEVHGVWLFGWVIIMNIYCYDDIISSTRVFQDMGISVLIYKTLS